MTASYEELQQIVKSQKRQQVALIVLSVVLAGSTIVTWKSVAAMREANEMQKQMLESRKVSATPKRPCDGPTHVRTLRQTLSRAVHRVRRSPARRNG